MREWKLIRPSTSVVVCSSCGSSAKSSVVTRSSCVCVYVFRQEEASRFMSTLKGVREEERSSLISSDRFDRRWSIVARQKCACVWGDRAEGRACVKGSRAFHFISFSTKSNKECVYYEVRNDNKLKKLWERKGKKWRLCRHNRKNEKKKKNTKRERNKKFTARTKYRIRQRRRNIRER